jgi:hypothetical protein
LIAKNNLLNEIIDEIFYEEIYQLDDILANLEIIFPNDIAHINFIKNDLNGNIMQSPFAINNDSNPKLE